MCTMNIYCNSFFTLQELCNKANQRMSERSVSCRNHILNDVVQKKTEFENAFP